MTTPTNLLPELSALLGEWRKESNRLASSASNLADQGFGFLEFGKQQRKLQIAVCIRDLEQLIERADASGCSGAGDKEN